MSSITVLGGTGYAGAHLVRAAAARGHQVTSFSRSTPDAAAAIEGVTYVSGDIQDAAALGRLVEDADVVVAAVPPRGELAGKVRGILAGVAEQAAAANVRFGVIGGAGSLQVAPGGPRLVDTPAFPEAFKAEAVELTDVLDDLRASHEGLDWFFVSPAAGFGAYAPGRATGTYRIGGDVLLADDAGKSEISGEDLADAIVKEIEAPAHHRARFTVAY